MTKYLGPVSGPQTSWIGNLKLGFGVDVDWESNPTHNECTGQDCYRFPLNSLRVSQHSCKLVALGAELDDFPPKEW